MNRYNWTSSFLTDNSRYLPYEFEKKWSTYVISPSNFCYETAKQERPSHKPDQIHLKKSSIFSDSMELVSF